MDLSFLADESDIRRKSFLEANSEEVIEDFAYVHQFTEEELLAMREQFSDLSINVDRMEEQKKEAVEQWNAKIKPDKAHAKVLLKGISLRSEQRRERIYVLHNYEDRRIVYVNDKGETVGERPMPGGIQMSLQADMGQAAKM